MRAMLSLIGIYKPSPSRITHNKVAKTEKKKELQPIVKPKPVKTAEQLNQDRLLALFYRHWKPPLRLKSS